MAMRNHRLSTDIYEKDRGRVSELRILQFFNSINRNICLFVDLYYHTLHDNLLFLDFEHLENKIGPCQFTKSSSSSTVYMYSQTIFRKQTRKRLVARSTPNIYNIKR